MELVGSYSNKSRTTQEFRDLLVLPADGRAERAKRHRIAQNRLRPSQLQQFGTDYRGGFTILQLALKYQIDRSTVFDHIARLRLTPRNPRLSSAGIREAKAMYKSGKSLAAIGEHLGVAPNMVNAALRKAGVEIRARY